MQSKNPIYEPADSGHGPVYESVPGESLKHLLSPDSTPTTPLANSDTRYTFECNPLQKPSLPPPRNGSGCQSPTLKVVEDEKVDLSEMPPSLVCGDDYMIMDKPVMITGCVTSTSIAASKDTK